jgi:SAM-dependent methyltransferase
MSHPLTKCSVCGNPKLRMVLSLGSSPPTCSMQPANQPRVEETHYPLDLMYCDDCTLAQLSVAVDPGVVFPVDYPYSSGNSKALHKNFQDLADQASLGLYYRPKDLVVDIGANDGTLLEKFGDCIAVGVEPTDQAHKASEVGSIYKGFFSEGLARSITKEFGQAKVITACNVLAHVEDIDDVMRGIRHLLAPDGVLIAENHDLASVVNGQWDTVYHEHLRFFSPYSFDWLLRKHGLAMQEWKHIPTHGGSFRMVASRTGHHRSARRREYDFDALRLDARRTRDQLRLGVTDACAYGIGATARATTIINYCGLNEDDIACVCEVSGSDKIGRLIPGTRIPVVDEARLFEDQPAEVVLFSWHMADVIVPKLREKGYEGEIIIPLGTGAPA